MIEMHVIFKGRVQGVGFRATTYSLAQELGLKGTVENLEDGTVEIYAQGEQDILNELLKRLQASFKGSQATSLSFRNPSIPLNQFRIKY